MKWADKPYHSLDYEMKLRYGEKVYRLTLNGNMTCPNRDGTLGRRGCIFCSAGGSGDFAAPAALSITEQMEQQKALLLQKRPVHRFIAYFQAYTNTYAPVEYLERIFTEAIRFPDVVALSIATRPDCIPDDVLRLLDSKTREEFKSLCSQTGGFGSYYGTSNSDYIHELVKAGDKKAVRIWRAMIYQVIKYIGSMSTVLKGEVDGILLTGGLLRFPDVEEQIKESCQWIAPVTAYPGEFEQEAMALGALRVLRGEEEARTYTGKPVWDGFEDDA